MDIAILGAGVAGSFLANILEDRHNIRVYDGNLMRGHYCAWGCFKNLLGEELTRIGLNVDDYILCTPQTLILNGIYIKLRSNQVSIDKPKMLKDIWPQTKVIPRHVPMVKQAGADLTVNATAKPLGKYHEIATKQSKANLVGTEEKTIYINIDPKYVGYSWAFPLDSEGKEYHLGAGCVNADPAILIDKLLKRYKIEAIGEKCQCNRSIAVVNPDEVEIVKNGIVSIGEAAGLVHPLTGEGTLSALESANLLAGSLNDDTFPSGFEDALKTTFLNEYKNPYKIWGLMEKHPRLSWVLGVKYLLNRTKARAQPVITNRVRLKIARILLT